MKKKTVWTVLAVVLIVVVIAVGVVCSMPKTVVLGEEYPFLNEELLAENVIAAWGEDKDLLRTVRGDYASILRDARVTKRSGTQMGPDVGMLIYLIDFDADYSVEVGEDGFLSVALTDNLEGTRTYWKDKDGDLFDKLYQCYLANGGEEILN